jgi:hypothetical protein
MQTLSNPDDFVRELKYTRRIKFEDDKLKVEINVCEDRSCKKSYLVKYYHLINGQWVSFSYFLSQFLNDIIFDFKYQYKIYNE